MTLLYKRLSNTSRPPMRATPGSAGYDLYSPITFVLRPGEQRTVFTDLALGIPEGHYGRVAPKSGLTLKYEIDVKGGVIDSDYRGNVGVILRNLGDKNFYRHPGQAIAQLILEKITLAPTLEVEQLPPTERGPTGFGANTPAQPRPLARPWQP